MDGRRGCFWWSAGFARQTARSVRRSGLTLLQGDMPRVPCGRPEMYCRMLMVGYLRGNGIPWDLQGFMGAQAVLARHVSPAVLRIFCRLMGFLGLILGFSGRRIWPVLVPVPLFFPILWNPISSTECQYPPAEGQQDIRHRKQDTTDAHSCCGKWRA